MPTAIHNLMEDVGGEKPFPGPAVGLKSPLTATVGRIDDSAGRLAPD